MNPVSLKVAQDLLHRPEVKTLLSLVAMETILKNNTDITIDDRSSIFFLDRGMFIFLEELYAYRAPETNQVNGVSK